MKTVRGQPSWEFASSHVRAFVTRLGGHLAPASFRLGSKTVQPFAVAPWAGEKVARGTPDVLRALRGDFFCCPFGGNGTHWHGERHSPHGETANLRWRLRSIEKSGGRVTTLHASLFTGVRKGRVDKYLTLIDGQTAIYSRHVLSGMRGPMSVGHHALLKFPDEPGSGVITTSRFTHGQVFPDLFELPDHAGYQSLRPGARFRSLHSVPALDGGRADLTRFPARKGYDDLVMLTAARALPFAWTAVTFAKEGYLWFALRDPRVLRHTILWMSNGGRHYAPWNGRHTGVMGLEDVTGYFHYGLAESVRRNPLNVRGIPTALKLDPQRPTTINTIMAVAAIPPAFDRVTSIKPVSGGADAIAANGRRVHVALDLQHLAKQSHE